MVKNIRLACTFFDVSSYKIPNAARNASGRQAGEAEPGHEASRRIALLNN